MTDFVHLRLHTEFSIHDGSIAIDKAISLAIENKMPALAITDLNNGFAWIKFYQTAYKKGIKPILGSDINVDGEQVLFLIQNHAGYLNLCEILSKTWQTGEPNISKEELLSISSNLNGIIILLGNPKSNLYKLLLNNNIDKSIDEINYWKNIVQDRLYIEIQHNHDSNIIWANAIEVSTKTNTPLVATHPVQFPTQDDFNSHEVRVCISQGDTLANPNRKKLFNPEQYFKSTTEMQELFKNIPSALKNSVEIAKRCNLELTLGKPRLPDFETPNNISLDEFLHQLSMQGLEQRIEEYRTYANIIINDEEKQKYIDRLDFEVQTIVKMGFAGYFLIVADFINWAKNNGIPVGPGRGSGAGSIVAYSLGITDIDPIPYNLLFERFLNPERVSMPDFDIDFCQHGRDKVIQYVKDKYGENAVSQIATFGTMAAKAAVRDVGRALDLGYNFVDGIAKLIPFKPTKHVTIASSLEEEPLLAQREQNEEEVKQLLSLAQKLEGLSRNVGMHAGGVLIAPGKLTDFCPLYSQDGQTFVSQYDKDDVESVGLVKFDFLGLTTLTILDIAQKYIQKVSDSNFNYKNIKLTDKGAFDILKTANTVSVFQLESRGMQSMLKDALPDRFEDIIALVSLYRPGPMDLIPSYIARKHGREIVVYPDDRVAPVLEETYGIMVYQEQVMQMAQIVGGYTLGGADLLRRAMGKKKPEEMAEHRQIFRDGAEKNGVNAEKADEIFDLMEKFAGYGFNKSHATAYALLAYYTAWFKAYHKECFMAANLSLAMDDTEKTAVLVADCKQNNIKILAPDIHTSEYTFTPIKNSKENISIMYGLGAIKGLGKHAIEHIIEERKNGNFTSFFDFAKRIDKKVINKRSFEALVKSGAFDCLGYNRGTLFKNIDIALELANQISAQQSQVSLFDDYQDAAPLPELIENEWDIKTQLKEEKSVLGFYFSGHLFDAYEKKASSLIKHKINAVSIGKDKAIVGIISEIRTQITSRGKMLVLGIEDGSAKIECMVFSEVLDSANSYLKEDECVYITGDVRLDTFNQTLRINAQKIYTLDQAQINTAKAIILYV
ncbi:MAG: polymerase subunit alpha, partial [Pseudomonadota bacterium]